MVLRSYELIKTIYNFIKETQVIKEIILPLFHLSLVYTRITSLVSRSFQYEYKNQFDGSFFIAFC